MTKFIQGAFKNKAAMIVLIVAVLGMGVFSYFKMPMEFLPEADNPQVTVTAIGPGYDASSMEQNVTNPIEQALVGVKGTTNVFSTSGDGFTQVNLNFDGQTDMKEAKLEVEQAVNNVALPERVSKPFVIQFNTSMIPISFVSMTYADDNISEADKNRLEKRVTDAFKGIDGVGQVQLSGKSMPKISVVPNVAKLAEKNVPFQALYGVLQGRDASASVGEKLVDGTAVNLNVTANLDGVESMKKLPVVPGVTLAEVADVTLVPDTESVNRIDGKPALMIVVSKGANANAVDVGKDVKKTMETLAEENKELNFRLILSTADQVVHSVDSMMREVLLGALFATIVILFFIRNIRATLVTIVSIPLSLGLTLYLLDMSGVTLNILTLGGVAVAVGRLVDDSIVVIENIFRRLQKEKFSVSLIIDATREVSTAITVSTLSTVAIFLPIGLLKGSLQSFLLPFALTITYSLLASLLVALTVVPLMSAGLLKATTIKEHTPSKRFKSFLHWNLRFKWVSILIAVMLLVGSVITYFTMPKGAIDSSSASSLRVTLEYKPDTPVSEVLENGKKLEAFLMKLEGQEWVSMGMGNSAEAAQWGSVVSPTLVNYMLQMKEGADAEKVMEAVKAERPNYQGATLNIGKGDFFSPASSTQVFVDVTGNDLEQISKTAGEAIAAIKPIKDVIQVQSNQEDKKAVYTLEVDPAKAKAGDIAQQLQGMLNAVPIGKLSVNGQSLNVLLEPALAPKTQSDLSNLTVMTDNGPQPVSSLAKWVKSEKPTQYFHKDGKSYVRITASVEPSQLSIVGAEITKAMANVKPPEGVKLNVGGASVDQSGDIAELMSVALVSILLVFLILVFTYKRIKASIAALSSLLFVPIGAVLGLLISGISPDFTAIFGVFMLIGIVVTNAIVLIDRVRHNEETMTIRESLIEAAATRMRPILMTAVATVGAMTPLLFGSAESGSIVSKSLAIVVIGGLIAATLLTLVVVPCIYELLYFRKSARERRAAKQQQQAAA